MMKLTHQEAAQRTTADKSSELKRSEQVLVIPESQGNTKSSEEEAPEERTSPKSAAQIVDPEADKSPEEQQSEEEISESQGATKSSEGESPKKKKAPKKNSDELMKYVGDLFADLKSHKTYDNKEVLGIMKKINNTYWGYKSTRKAVGNRLVEHGLAAQAVKMMKWFNEAGVFRSDDIWYPTYYTYMVCWNYTDASRELAMDLGNAGLVRICSLNIQHSPYLDNIESKNVTFMLKASLSILQNLAAVPELKDLYDEENVKDALKPFLAHEKDFFRALATMILTSIITEEENARLSDTGSIEFIVKGLRISLTKAKTRRYRGLSPLELVQCLGRMAVNDQNKKRIVELEALPLLVMLLQGKNEAEQLAAAKTLWTLAFDKEVKEKIKIEAGCTEELEKLTDSPNARVQKSAKGALWMLKDNVSKQNQSTEKAVTGKRIGHIFISYCWSQQAEIIQLNTALQAAGYKVWLDLEQMGGSTLESMAAAVENATVVLICASSQYKESPNCRTEAEYTFQLKKPIIPLMLQRTYKADGWLGMIMGAKLYINFDGKHPFDTAFTMLERELKGRGKEGADHSDFVDAPVKQVSQAASPLQGTSIAPSMNGVSSWNKEQVGKWLEKYELGSKVEKFAGYDGARFSKLLVVRHEAPEFFYKFLEEKMSMDLLEISSLLLAMDSLP